MLDRGGGSVRMFLMDKFWADLPKKEWHEVARMMGLTTSTDGPGSRSAMWFIERLERQALDSNEPFTEMEREFLSRHTMSVEPLDMSAIAALQEKVTRLARATMKSDLQRGVATTKVGMFARWPTEWYDHYRALIESMNPTMVSGLLQNAFAPDGKFWKP